MSEETKTEERNDEPQKPVKVPMIAGAKPSAIVPQDFEGCYRLANIIAQSGMAPKVFGNSVPAITVAIMHGLEVGLTPMAALQSIVVINGMPSIWGDGALGLVRASGKLEYIHEKIETTPEGLFATCEIKRKDDPLPIFKSFTQAQAIKANLWSKDIWKLYPTRMLQMRARSWALRDGFADVLRGLSIAEEARDFVTLENDGTGTYRVEPSEAPQEAPEGPPDGPPDIPEEAEAPATDDPAPDSGKISGDVPDQPDLLDAEAVDLMSQEDMESAKEELLDELEEVRGPDVLAEFIERAEPILARFPEEAIANFVRSKIQYERQKYAADE